MPYKVCTNCNSKNGVRTLICKQCQSPFMSKSNSSSRAKARRRRKNRFIKNWRSLSPGDVVRVVGGSGPFYHTSDGMRHYLTDRGKYEVESIDSNGIHVRGVAPRTSGHQFLYMGPLKKSSLCMSLYRDKHKLLAVSLQPRESNGV